MAAATVSPGGLTRREFLYYIWGASIALVTVEFTGLIVWFMLPRFREGEFGGTFTLPIDILPDVNEPPFNYPDGRFWLVNVDNEIQAGCERMWSAEGDGAIKGAVAIYKVCTHLGCIYAWVDANNRYECPCHGSKYRLDGRRIQDPAPRNLDRFKLVVLDATETIIAESALGDDGTYQAIPIPSNAAFIRVDTGDKKQGIGQTLLSSFPTGCP